MRQQCNRAWRQGEKMRIRWQLIILSVFFCALTIQALQHDSHSHMGNESVGDPGWSGLTSSMEKMHGAIAAIGPSGATDVDFVRLMLPHHQAAIDRAKTARSAKVSKRLGFLGERRTTMRIIRWFQIFCFLSVSFAQQAPWGRPDIPVSSHDRVYAANQTSNTVSVIDPSNNRLLGVIRLGDPVPGALSPLYKGQLLVHGLGYAPDGKTLAVVSVGSNSVTLIDTATNKVKGTVYVGRSPHEAFFTSNGRELWVTVRGEDYISV